MPANEGPEIVAPPTAGPGKTTLLMYACSQGDLQQVKHILQNQPSSAVQRDRTLKTALHYCAGGNTRPVTNTYYLTNYPKTDFTVTNVNNNIISGGEPGLAHCADLLVMAAPTLVDTRDADGFTPLHLAVISGNMQLVNFLLANGADVNALDAEKHSVVHWATVCGETGALGAVLGVGAKVSTPDVHGGYPLHYAAQMCGSEKPELGLQVLHILLSQPSISVTVEDNDGRQPLLWAASAGSARAVLALVRAGATVESADKDGLTALHCAASRGHTDTLDTLLTLCGATPDVIDTNGCTALHYSVTLGHADATALLLAHGADPNRQDRKGRSPAHCGCAKGQLETVKQLGTHGANLWLRNARGDLPLHEAAASGRRALIKWLLDQRPSQVNARNNDGRSPLHLAALNDNADMCKILLDAGAQVNPILRTSKNVFMTPLDCALQRGFRSTAKFLQLHGGVPASRLANTPSTTLRMGTEITSNFGSASNIHIREDVTVFGGSSSETDVEETQKKDNRPRRRSVRRRVTHRQDKKYREEASASDTEVNYRVKHGKSSVKDKGEINIKRESKVKLKNREANDQIDEISVKSDGQKFKKKQKEISPSETDLTSPENNYKSAKSKRDKSVLRDKSKTRKKQDIENEETQDQDEDSQDGNEIESNLERKKQTTLPSKKSKKQIEDSIELSDKDKLKSSKKESRKSAKSVISKQEQNKLKENLDGETSENLSSDRNDTLTRKSKKSDISDSDHKKRTETTKRAKSKSRDSKSEHKSDSSSLEQQKLKEEIESKKISENGTVLNEDKLLEEEKAQTSDQQSENFNKEQETEKNKEENSEVKSTKLDETTKIPEVEETKVSNEENELSPQSLQPDQVSIQSKLSEESPSKTIVVEASVHPLPKGISSQDISEEVQITDQKESSTKEEKTEHLPEELETESKEDKTEQEGKEAVINEEKLETKNDVDANVENKVEEQQVPLEKSVESVDETKQEEIPSITDETKEKSKEIESTTENQIEPEERKEEVDQTALEEKAKDVSEPEVNKTEITEEVNKNETKIDEGQEVKLEDQTDSKDTEAVTEAENEKELKKDDAKQELNIDLSLKKFEETAGYQNGGTDIEENEDAKNEEISENKSPDIKQKKYSKKIKTSKNGTLQKQNETKLGEEHLASSSTSREGSSTESDTEKPKSKSGIVDTSEHKSFKVLKDDVAFEVLNDGTPKETRRVKHKSKKRLKEIERLNESATSSPEMQESTRSRTKSRDRDSKSVHLIDNLTLPALPEHRRPESNLSAPNLSSIYSDNEHKSGSNSELDDESASASRKRRFKRRKLRLGSKSAGSDYESSNLIDSGFEPSPRSSRIPKRKVMSERGVNMTSVTQQIQSNIRRYHMERKIFQHLLDLKRLQIRSGQANEAMLVKRAIDAYHNSVAASVGAGRYMKKDFTYKSFEQFLYQSLRMLQKSPVDYLKGLPEPPDNPLLCTQSTHRCLHATHAYTGIPCAAYLPKMNHHTMPKIGFTPRSSSSFLPQINSKAKSVTLELCHGNDKQVISLPADRLDHNKRYYVTFTVKGQDAQSPTTDQQDTTTHRHAKSV